jgi:hypothetical protein
MHPSGAKALLSFIDFIGLAKAMPSLQSANLGVFPQPVKPNQEADFRHG